MNITVVTQPAVEPITVEFLKTATHISNSVEDDVLNMWIKSGREHAEAFHRRSYITQTIDLTFDNLPCSIIELPMGAVQSLTSFKYYDVDNVEYEIETDKFFLDNTGTPARLVLNYGETYPTVTLRELNSVIIRYVAGYGDAGADVPDFVKDAIVLYCTFRHENRAGEVDTIPDNFYNLLRNDRA